MGGPISAVTVVSAGEGGTGSAGRVLVPAPPAGCSGFVERLEPSLFARYTPVARMVATAAAARPGTSQPRRGVCGLGPAAASSCARISLLRSSGIGSGSGGVRSGRSSVMELSFRRCRDRRARRAQAAGAPARGGSGRYRRVRRDRRRRSRSSLPPRPPSWNTSRSWVGRSWIASSTAAMRRSESTRRTTSSANVSPDAVPSDGTRREARPSRILDRSRLRQTLRPIP